MDRTKGQPAMIGHLLFRKPACLCEPATASIDICGRAGRIILRLAAFILKSPEGRAGRRSVQSLDDHMLKDIGLLRCDVDRELRTNWRSQ